MPREGFEPTEARPAVLQTALVDHLSTLACLCGARCAPTMSLCRGSDPRPQSYQDCALPTELQRRNIRKTSVLYFGPCLFAQAKNSWYERCFSEFRTDGTKDALANFGPCLFAQAKNSVFIMKRVLRLHFGHSARASSVKMLCEFRTDAICQVR